MENRDMSTLSRNDGSHPFDAWLDQTRPAWRAKNEGGVHYFALKAAWLAGESYANKQWMAEKVSPLSERQTISVPRELLAIVADKGRAAWPFLEKHEREAFDKVLELLK